MAEGKLPITKKGWEDIGMHRQLGSFFYNYIFLIIMALAALLKKRTYEDLEKKKNKIVD